MAGDSSNELMNLSALLRASADGELDAEDRARLEAHLRDHPEDSASIEFERALRAACGRVMGPVSAPAGLRERILENARRAESKDEQAVAEQIEALSPATRQRSYWNRLAPALQRVAAALLLVVGGFFLYQMFTLGSGTSAHAHMSEIASFVGAEHDRCIIDPARASKFNIRELEQAPAQLEAIVGRSISPANLAVGGLSFRDGGRCRVPGGGDSVHLRFDTSDPPGGVVSLFIQRVTDDSDMIFEAGKSYQLQADHQGADNADSELSPGAVVYGWVADGLNYFLVADDREICEQYCAVKGLAPAQPIGDS